MLETTHVSRTLSRIPSLYLIPSPLHIHSPSLPRPLCDPPPGLFQAYLPGTFLATAHDLADPWDDGCQDVANGACCVDTGKPVDARCNKAHRGYLIKTGPFPGAGEPVTPSMGPTIHPRVKLQVRSKGGVRGHRSGALPIHPRFTPCSLSHSPLQSTPLHSPCSTPRSLPSPTLAHPRPPSTLCRWVRASPRPHGASCTVTTTSRGPGPSSTGAP